MPSTLDRQNDKGLFALFKGDPGSGKSVAALSFPKPYVFDFDKKMPVISHKHYPNKEIVYDTFGEISEMIDRMEELRNNCPYETLICDSVTSLCDLSIRTIGKMKGETTKKLFHPQSLKGQNKQLEMMSIDYYNGEFRLIRDYWLDALKALWIQPGNPKHVIVIAHVLTVESAPDLKTKQITTSRSIVTAGRKVAVYIPTQFDNEFMFVAKRPELWSDDKLTHRICFTAPYGDDDARTTYKLPDMIDFTNSSFYDKFNHSEQNSTKSNWIE